MPNSVPIGAMSSSTAVRPAGERVMVVALTRQYFADLAPATGPAGTFAEKAGTADYAVPGEQADFGSLPAPW